MYYIHMLDSILFGSSFTMTTLVDPMPAVFTISKQFRQSTQSCYVQHVADWWSSLFAQQTILEAVFTCCHGYFLWCHGHISTLGPYREIQCKHVSLQGNIINDKRHCSAHTETSTSICVRRAITRSRPLYHSECATNGSCCSVCYC